MATEIARNAWGVIVHHASERILELRWLPSTMNRRRLQGNIGPVRQRGGEGQAVLPADRRDGVSPQLCAGGHGMAKRRDHSALWRGRREKIRVSDARRLSQYDGIRRPGSHRRSSDLPDRVVLGAPKCVELAGGRVTVVLGH